MNFYRVIGNELRVNAGTVVLDARQYNARKHALTSANSAFNDEFRILKPVSFKRGEEFGFSEPLNKMNSQLVELIGVIDEDGIHVDDIEGMPAKSLGEVLAITFQALKKLLKDRFDFSIQNNESIVDGDICRELLQENGQEESEGENPDKSDSEGKDQGETTDEN